MERLVVVLVTRYARFAPGSSMAWHAILRVVVCDRPVERRRPANCGHVVEDGAKARRVVSLTTSTCWTLVRLIRAPREPPEIARYAQCCSRGVPPANRVSWTREAMATGVIHQLAWHTCVAIEKVEALGTNRANCGSRGATQAICAGDAFVSLARARGIRPSWAVVTRSAARRGELAGITALASFLAWARVKRSRVTWNGAIGATTRPETGRGGATRRIIVRAILWVECPAFTGDGSSRS